MNRCPIPRIKISHRVAFMPFHFTVAHAIHVAVGQLDQLAKEIFAEETAAVTGGGAAWMLPGEIGLTAVRLDGLLRVRQPARVSRLAAPVPAAGRAVALPDGPLGASFAEI